MQQRSFEDLGAPLYEVSFCVVDLETTGGSAASDAITEIGAVKYVGGEEVGSFQTLVDPAASIPPFITLLTGITHAMVVEAPKIEVALPTFLEFLGQSVIVGHNVSFDLGFLNTAAQALGYPKIPNRSVDTAALARRLVSREVRNLKLSTLAAHLRSPVTPNHRALEDARATAHVLHSLLERAGTLGVTALEDLLELPRARGAPHYSKIHLTDSLPRRPGVYLFKDRHDEIFYVGKAKNLRARVRQYFYGDKRRSVGTMLSELTHIEHRLCETELEASVAELRLIHAHRPRHNRRSKPPHSPHFVKLTTDTYPRLSIVRTLREDGALYLGPFRNRRGAQLVVWAIWDAVPIRRCAGKPGSQEAPCSFSQLDVALCPCDGSLTEADYRTVVTDLIAGIQENPSALLAPLEDKMLERSRAQRFEEAARLRDRHDALARTISRRWQWQALAQAGSIIAVDGTGASAAIENGRLVAAWAGSDMPLLPRAKDLIRPPEVPESVEAADEAALIWKWLMNGTTLLDARSPLTIPARQIPQLAA